MKKALFPVLIAAIVLGACNGPAGEPRIVIDSVVEKNNNMDLLSKERPSFDSSLAAAVGADEYGMKQYVMAILKEGPNRDQDSAASDSIFHAHLKNIMRLADEGKLVEAGPFTDDSDVKGIFILNVSTVEEAKAITDTDPAIHAGRLIAELHPWYGSAALVMLMNLHHRVENKSVTDM